MNHFKFFLVFFVRVVMAQVKPAGFPPNFFFGFSTASYQIEGGWNEDGKGENVWDRLVHTRPELVKGRATGDVACDSYHRYKEDVQLLKNLGSEIYRFSLSWSRILPKGDISYINHQGIEYYKSLIKELIKNNVKPMVTLFHWDLPQPLQDLGGWTNPLMVEYFEDYCRLAFNVFGNEVKLWITFNEPYETCRGAYGSDWGAPLLNKSGVADYLCAHTILKSHARVYHLYNDEFRKRQNGQIGISLNGGWNEPLTDMSQDREAAETTMEFQVGWFLHPLLRSGGDYPAVMRNRIDGNSRNENLLRSRLPVFSEKWISYMQGTLDFLGINHYTTYLATPSNSVFSVPSYENDLGVSLSQNKSWPGSSASWLRVEPIGFRKKLNWLKNYTNNFPIIITENGFSDNGELEDSGRINYHKLYLAELLKAINEDNCNVWGYVAWSLMDNFEWLDGYEYKFGVYKVDFSKPDLPRTAKASVQFFKNLIKIKSSSEVSLFLNDIPT